MLAAKHNLILASWQQHGSRADSYNIDYYFTLPTKLPAQEGESHMTDLGL